METLIARIRSAPQWDETVASDLLDTVTIASRDGNLPQLLEELGPTVEDDVAGPVQFLRTLIQALGESQESRAQLEAFLERLNQEEHWSLLGRLALGAAELLHDASFCRYVARAGEVGGLEELPEGTLDRALAVAPDNHRLLWLKASRLEASGQPDVALTFTAQALPGWAHAKDVTKVEDGLIKLLEFPNTDQWRLAWDAVADLARQGETRPMTSFLELGFESLGPLGLQETVWQSLRRMVETGHATRRIRKVAADLAKARYSDIKSIDRILDRSGLGSADVPMKQALKDFERLLKYAPGLMVIHKGFGPGKIVDNDGETVVIDFAGKAGHRMSLAIAERSLDILPPDDLKTIILTEPDKLKALRKEDPVGLLVMALTKLGGDGGNSDVRKLLVPEVMTAQTWPAWWKKVTALAKDDERIDSSQTFRRMFRLPEEGESASILPLIQEKADLHANLDMIHRFLDQHPEHEDEARRIYRPRIVQWLNSMTKPEAQLHLYHVLRRWDADVRADFLDALATLLGSGGDFSFTTVDVEQLDLLQSARDAGMGAQAGLAALPSRHRSVRTKAAAALREDLGDELPKTVRDLYTRSPQDEARVLGLVEFGLEDPEALPEAMDEPGYGVQAVIAIVQGASREPSRRQALSVLKTGSPAAAALRERPLDQRRFDVLLRILTEWRTTDRHLFPVLDFLESSESTELVDAVRRYRTERSAELVSRTKDASDEAGVLMTRGSMVRLRDEIEELELALRTTIPEVIRTAREHGDLKENAEYHAAKDKQAHFNQRLGQLQSLLGSARAIEDLDRQADVAGPGTRVRALDVETGEEREFWILGEGDSHYGDSVISYRAPLGASLSGHRIGEVVVVGLEAGERRLRLLEVTPKLPEHEAGTPSSS